MKYLKNFNENSKIERKCNAYGIEDYKINDDQTLDVFGDVLISDKGMNQLPFKFGIVTGKFMCYENYLTSLEGSPSYVGGTFNCFNNYLTSLEFGPKTVGGSYWCEYNRLESLKHSPIEVGNDFRCIGNKIKSLEWCPKSVGGQFLCGDNEITDVNGCPKNCTYYGFSKNPILKVVTLLLDITPIGIIKIIEIIESYDVIRANNISWFRMSEAIDELSDMAKNNIHLPTRKQFELISEYKIID